MSKRKLSKDWYKNRILDLYKGVELVLQSIQRQEALLAFYMEMKGDTEEFKQFITTKEDEARKKAELLDVPVPPTGGNKSTGDVQSVREEGDAEERSTPEDS